jgi:hypothetical protein
MGLKPFAVMAALLTILPVAYLQVRNSGTGQSVSNTSEDVLIKVTDLPGFGLNGQSITKTIVNDGTVRIESKQYGDTQPGPLSSTVRVLKLRPEQVQALVQFINATKFFELTRVEYRNCDSRSRTVTLEIRIGKKSNSVRQIGAECTRGKVADAQKIVDRVDEILKTVSPPAPRSAVEQAPPRKE